MMSFEKFKSRFPHLREGLSEEEFASAYRDLTLLAEIAAELALERARSNSHQEVVEVEAPDEVR
jgi:uncharacterized protein (DUF433 family)